MRPKISFFSSLKFAFRGLFWVLKNERNFQIEFLFFIINLVLIFVLNLTKYDSIIIIFLCFLVMSAELFNTAIEKLCDFVHSDFHPIIGKIKDISAAAVVCLAILSLVVGCIIYYPYFIFIFG